MQLRRYLKGKCFVGIQVVFLKITFQKNPKNRMIVYLAKMANFCQQTNILIKVLHSTVRIIQLSKNILFMSIRIWFSLLKRRRNLEHCIFFFVFWLINPPHAFNSGNLIVRSFFFVKWNLCNINSNRNRYLWNFKSLWGPNKTKTVIWVNKISKQMYMA